MPEDISSLRNKINSHFTGSKLVLTHYPLLGGLAASFQIAEDVELCHKYEIHIAAVDAEQGIIYANPSCDLSKEEWILCSCS